MAVNFRPRHAFAHIVLAALALASAACGFEQKSSSPLSPSDEQVSARGYLGDWASASPIAVPSFSTCTNVRWMVNNWVGTQVSGTFTATCAGGLQATGTGTATLTTTNADWIASGTAVQSGVTCPFSMTGTATLASSKIISLSYTGTVCGTSVQGTEDLSKG